MVGPLFVPSLVRRHHLNHSILLRLSGCLSWCFYIILVSRLVFDIIGHATELGSVGQAFVEL